MHQGTVDFEGRQARVFRYNDRMGMGMPHSASIGLDLGDARIELSGYFRDGEFIETSRKPLD